MALHKHHYGDDIQYAGRGLLYMVVLTVVGAFSWAIPFQSICRMLCVTA